jgi:SAM-dependent methyltransferase
MMILHLPALSFGCSPGESRSQNDMILILAEAAGQVLGTMTETEESRNARYFDSLAAKYDELMSSRARNSWIRDAFRSLVLDTVPPGSLLLDFGCGTGTDTIWYAEQGYRVIAYDNSPGMMEQLRAKCAGQIARGEVRPYSTDYETFLKRELRPSPVAVVSNFAAFSVVADLQRLFAALSVHLATSGYVIASMVNPLFWKEMFRWWWWKSSIQSLGQGMIHVRGDGIATRRYFASYVTAAASPYFTGTDLAGVGALTRNKGCHLWSAPRSLAERLEHRLWKKPFFRHLGQFTFFVFRKS